jgi:hypothetical protein
MIIDRDVWSVAKILNLIGTARTRLFMRAGELTRCPSAETWTADSFRCALDRWNALDQQRRL